MSLQSGARLGSYEIQGPLGEGGMGEVYKARDARLDRVVAIKVLPASFVADADRLKRFEREAKTVGGLTHPNIVTIYELNVEGGAPFIAMELVPGETLRQRLHGPIATRKAIDYATQIANGLAAAHEHGVVHRDLKPDNIIVTPDGRLKILDFGLARHRQGSEAGGGNEVTTQFVDTTPGTVLGTVGYMAPEQVRGEASVDHRADIFALGAIVYEMLSGKRAFQAGSAVETMTAIVREEPADLTRVAADVSPGLVRLVHRCLEKSPAERFQSARDLAFHLAALSSDSATRSGVEQAPALPAARPSRLLPIAAAVAGLVAGAAIAWFTFRQPAVEPTRFETFTFSGDDASPAASPDGRTIAFESSRSGRSQIWLRQVDGGGERALTEGPDDRVPRFSPDGTALIFLRFDGGKSALIRTPVLGGEARRLLDNVISADYSPDGSSVVFLTDRTEGDPVLGIIRPDGSARRDLRTFHERNPAFVRWSPDGQSLALVLAPLTGTTAVQVALMPAAGGEPRLLRDPVAAEVCTIPAWTADGRELVYGITAGGLYLGNVNRSARMVAHDVRTDTVRTLFWTVSGPTIVDVVSPGVLAYDSTYESENLRLSYLTRALAGGASTDRWLTHGSSIDRQPVISPDGNWILFTSSRSQNLDLWLMSRTDGTLRRLTDDAAADWDPAFMPDGKNIIWSSNRGGNFEIWTAALDGSGARQLTHDGVDAENPTATPDGQWIVHWSSNPAKLGIWKVRSDGSGATPLATGAFVQPDTSPDGQYVAAQEAPQGERRRLRVFRVSDGSPVPFSITVDRNGSIDPNYGRLRWMPGGKAIAFTANGPDGRSGIFVQDFVPGQDTTASRRRLAGFVEGQLTESFGVAKDGSVIVLAMSEKRSELMLAHGIPNLLPPRRGTR